MRGENVMIKQIKHDKIVIGLLMLFMTLALSCAATSAADFQIIQDEIDSGSNTINLGNGLYTPGTADTINVNKNNVVIRGQSASSKAILDGQGGNSRIMRISGDNVRLENLIFRNADVDSSYGAGVYAAGSNLTIINCEFINNKGINGGLILHEDSTNALIQNCIFVNNKAAYLDTNGGGGGAGGAIDSHSSNGRIINCTFTNNSGINGGGALYFIIGTNNTISGCTFTGNSAPRGGAIWAGTSGTTLTVSSSIFNNNKATGNGGAIYSNNRISISSSSFNKNTANNNGGGLYTTGTSRSTVTGSKFTNNSAKNGGGIYNNAPLSISSSNFASNKASSNGGGIYANKDLNISGGSIKSNTAANCGSGIYKSAGTLRTSKVSMGSNLAKVVSITLKAPTVVKPNKGLTVNFALKTGDNIGGAIYNKNGNVYINGTRRNILTYTPSKTFSTVIAGNSKKITSNLNGVATRTYSVGVKSKSNIVVKISYSQGGKTWSVSNSVKVSSTAKSTIRTSVSNKSTTNKPSTKNNSSSTTIKSGNNVKIPFLNHENAHLASLINLSNYNVNSKKISYWNLKKNSNVVTDYFYMVNNSGWYRGTNSSGVLKWTTKLSKVPTTHGNWLSITRKSNGSYSIGNVVSKHTKATSDNKLMYFVSSRKTSINHKSLTPYIRYTYELTNKKTGSKVSYHFYEKSDSSIYLLIDDSSKKLKDYGDYLVNSKKAPTDNKAITSLTKSIISEISGELTPTKKAEALFNWVKNNIKYPPKSRFYECTKKMAIGTLSSKEANCVDQSSLLISMLRTAKIPSKYIHYKSCTFSSGSVYGHVWVSVFVGNWVESDTTSSRNSFGKIVNFSNRKTKHGPHIIIDI
ncbi:hypothetical protein KQY27_06855 [Methanobrevibacter sp. TMH8]|uniref:transglutaminase domain-containing protein n=1 Tax=Methanobrevibacter sp. TMH8 TaxID=2848611 RepID=UPI001CCDB097|nr:transglutaminase domain-containing protein [Methanobrevibacter sp. TMH8]MBZ9571260.1 hypothetical protein [Methanobrevibacter sp. TMH8]